MRTTTKSNWSLLLTGSIYNFYSRSSSSLSLPQARWPPSASLLSDGCVAGHLLRACLQHKRPPPSPSLLSVSCEPEVSIHVWVLKQVHRGAGAAW